MGQGNLMFLCMRNGTAGPFGMIRIVVICRASGHQEGDDDPTGGVQNQPETFQDAPRCPIWRR